MNNLQMTSDDITVTLDYENSVDLELLGIGPNGPVEIPANMDVDANGVDTEEVILSESTENVDKMDMSEVVVVPKSFKEAVSNLADSNKPFEETISDLSNNSFSYDSGETPILSCKSPTTLIIVEHDPAVDSIVEQVFGNSENSTSVQTVAEASEDPSKNRKLQKIEEEKAVTEEMAELEAVKVRSETHITSVSKLVQDWNQLSPDVVIDLHSALTETLRECSSAHRRLNSVSSSRYFYRMRKNRKNKGSYTDVELLGEALTTLSAEATSLIDQLAVELGKRLNIKDNLDINRPSTSNRRWETNRNIPYNRNKSLISSVQSPDRPCSSSSLKRDGSSGTGEQSPPKIGKLELPAGVVANAPPGDAAVTPPVVAVENGRQAAPAAPVPAAPAPAQVVGNRQVVEPPAAVPRRNHQPVARPVRRNNRACRFCGRQCWTAGCEFVTDRAERIAILDADGVCLRCLARHPGRKCLSSHRCRLCGSTTHHQAVCSRLERRRQD